MQEMEEIYRFTHERKNNESYKNRDKVESFDNRK